MNCDRERFRLYAVAGRPPEGVEKLLWQLDQALAAGVTLLQLREKAMDEEEFLREALLVRALASRWGVPLIINDQVSVAIRCGADGVHIGQTDLPARRVRDLLGPEKLLGVTAKTADQARQAFQDGADYLGAGALFPSPTKGDAVPMSAATLADICKAVPIPVVAIGGITGENIEELKGTGIAGAAVVSGIFGRDNIPAAVAALKNGLKEVIR